MQTDIAGRLSRLSGIETFETGETSRLPNATLACHSGFVEAGYNYLAAVRDGDPDPVITARRADFESCVRNHPQSSGLDGEAFKEFARRVLFEVSEGFGVPMDKRF